MNRTSSKLHNEAPPRWVLFDVGNVLINFDHATISETIQRQWFPAERQTETYREALDKFIFEPGERISRNTELDRGEKDIDWLRNEVCKEFGVGIPPSDFAEIWSSIFDGQLNADALGCLRKLQQSGLKVAICSNTNREHWESLLRRHPELHELSEEVRCFLSFQMRKTKTDPDFFRAIADATMSPRMYHLLVDDKAENCLSAETAYMHSIRFDPEKPGESVSKIIHFAEDHDLWRVADR